MTITIASLHSYPIKSCGAIDLQVSAVSQAGLSYDRQWMLADPDGRFMTQRQWPAMALIRPTLRDGSLWVEAPGMRALRVGDLAPPAEPRDDGRSLVVWRDAVPGQDEGDEVAAWFSSYLGVPCRLYRLHPQARRLASPDHVTAWRLRHGADAPALGPEHAFGFADGFPFLIANLESLAELNGRLRAKGEAAVPMERFRANVVVSGLEAYEEDYVASLRGGQIVLALVKPCARCNVPDTDQQTGQRGAEPGRTLASYRGRDDGVMFGQNAVVQAPPGAQLRVGDVLEAELDF